MRMDACMLQGKVNNINGHLKGVHGCQFEVVKHNAYTELGKH